ncbi:hypothetical protein [Fibrella forsythiae]|uniref:Uncharacterized protein n=1 Tax=Fibrella forsythiae TaxID=2817061 RepID=A0ABS3JT14_9BACT|nr:hypothetical protein [Fibrella forsythiae]MBO0953172.1 hypothetical protein [Fibrella forsythiae]
MARLPIEPTEPCNQSDRSYEQQWQEHLAYETRTRLALEEQQKGEKAQAYLYEINLAGRALLTSRHH